MRIRVKISFKSATKLAGKLLLVQNKLKRCLNPFSTKPYNSTKFFNFFAELCMHATLLIIVRLFSNLRCWIVHHLSFLEKKTELIYLHYRLFYNCLCILIHFLARNLQKDARTVKKPKLIFNLFPERKMIWKKFKRIRIPENRLFKWYKNYIN